MRTIAAASGSFSGQDEESGKSARVLTVGSSLEGICGAGAAVLAILALCHVLPNILIPIAAIAAGAALVFEGGAVSARFRDLERRLAGDRAGEAELAGGTAMELIGGAGAVVLGILALVGFYPAMFCAICAIAVGGALLLGSGATSRLDMLSVQRAQMNDAAVYAAHESILGASGLQALAGIAGVALGILALVGVGDVPMLIAIGLLCVGGAIFLSGSALVGKMATMLGG